MKFNPDCMRSILLYLEEHLSISSELEIHPISIQELCKNLSYSIPEIVNTVLILDEGKFISASAFGSNNQISELIIYRITYEGYQLIESIRSDLVWRKVKSVGKNIGSFSISIISKIASSVLVSLVNGLLTAPNP